MKSSLKPLKIVGIALVLGMVFFGESCRKDPVFNTSSDFRLVYSTDTVAFDTVFTSMGSVTMLLTVHNQSDKDVEISNVELVGGDTSSFRINVDGDTSLYRRNIRLRAKDSMFIFVKVTIDPHDADNPFEIIDYLRFTYNNRSENIVLRAFGQDAIYHPVTDSIRMIYTNGERLDTLYIPYSEADCSEPWTAGKPHIIYGYLLVNNGEELILEAGTHLHFAPDAGLLVANGGSLKIRGEFGKEVILEGMRLDAGYKDQPGQWNRIWLSSGSVNNEIDWAIIRNGKIGLWVDTVSNENPSLSIQNTIIHNMQSYGIYAQSAVIRGQNLQVNNCVESLLALTIGGDYAFEHCTFANYPDGLRKNPSILLNNYYTNNYGKDIISCPLVRADFTSCLVYGSSQEELGFDLDEKTEANYKFSYCLLRTERSTKDNGFENCLFNVNPQYKDDKNGNFEISSIKSAAFGKGKPNPCLNSVLCYDLKRRSRPYSPTIGAFEVEVED